MKWTLIAVGALVGIVILVVVIGALLPRNHVATTTATIDAPPDAVWRVISDPASASWRDVERVEMLGGVPTRWKEYSKHGAITMEQVEAVPPSKFVTRIADTDQGFGGSWTIALAPAPGSSGTKVTITEDGFVSNPMFRFMSRFVFGHYSTQEAYLRSLGKKFGQEVTPERVTTSSG